MTPERWKRIDEVFAAATELPGQEREAYLDTACGDDVELRAEIVKLLAIDAGADVALRNSVAAAAARFADATASSWIGRRIGPYRLVDLLGEGGMGVVYRGERADAVYKGSVAIKILQHGFGAPQAIARFRDERQILAALAHPGIVRLLDGGQTDDGLPYLVMEHVDGVPITRYARDHELSVRARVELLRMVCAALQYAHGKLVVHRDLKPSNILVDRGGAPKLLDFGIAKLTDPEGTREAKTRTGVALLTPEYASPEQARGEPVSVANDVYSLGAVLYELVAGRPPQHPNGGPLEILRAICEVEPPRPSTVARERRRELAGNLDNIVMKALHKEPARRYASVEQLADDLARYLDGRPVAARTATLGYRAGKFIRRNRGKLAIATVVSIALAYMYLRTEAARRVSQEQLVSSYEESGRRALLEGDASAALVYLSAALDMGARSTGLSFMVARAIESHDARLATLAGHDSPLWDAGFSPDGTRVVTVGSDGTARVWDTATGRELVRLDHHAPGIVMASFSADGRHVATKDSAGTLRVWHADTGRLVRALAGHRQEMPWFALGPDGKLVDGTGQIWDLETGDELAPAVHAENTSHVELARDGRRLVTIGSRSGRVVVSELGAGRSIELRGHVGPVWYARFSPDGRRVITSSLDATARIWDAESGDTLVVLRGHEQRLTHVAYSPTAELVATASADRTARLWDPTTGELRHTLRGHTSQVNRVVFTPDGRDVITVAGDGTARVFDARDGTLTATYAHGGFVYDADVSSDGQRLVTASWQGTAIIWALDRKRRVASWGAPNEQPAIATIASRDGTRLLRISADGALLWDPRSGKARALDVPTPLTAGDLGGDGDLVAIAHAAGPIGVHHAGDGSRVATITGHAKAATAVAFDPSGRRVASSDGDGNLGLWDSMTGAEIARVALARPIDRLVFSPGGEQLLVISEVGPAPPVTVSGTSLQTLATWATRQKEWIGATFSADGRMVAIGSETTCTIWSPDGQLAQTLPHDAIVNTLAWTAQGDRLATGTLDGTVTLWSTTRWTPTRFKAHDNYVVALDFSSDGKLLATSGGDRTVRVWEVASARQLFAFPLAEDMSPLISLDATDLLVVAGVHGLASWRTHEDQRSVRAVAEIVRCNVPLQLRDGRLFDNKPSDDCTSR